MMKERSINNERMRLGEICTINMGQSPDSSSYNDNQEGLPFYQGNADFGEKVPTPRVWCSQPHKVAHAGELLISVRAPIGAVNYADGDCCIGRGVAAIIPFEGEADIHYLFHLLKSKSKELQARGTGSTFKAISKNTLQGLCIPGCSLVDQKRITRELDTITSLISLRRQQLEKLNQLAKSQFIEMFGDVMLNDKHWPVVQLDSITTSRLGKMLDGKQQTGKNKYPYLANCNVQWFRFDLENLKEMDFNDADQAEFQLRDGDLMICEGGEIGRCAIWHNQIQPCFYQKAIHRVRCNTVQVIPEYLAWWFKNNCDRNAFDTVAGAKATIAHLPGEKLKKLQVMLPPLELQKRFQLFLYHLDKSKFAIEESIRKLELLYRSKLQEYFG